MDHRRRALLSSLVAVLAAGHHAWAAPRSLVELGRRFQALRKRQRAQPPGNFDSDLDGWNGELHNVMTELGRRLGVAGTKTSQVRFIMGEPDEKTAARWVYWWRGGHDYLFFELAKATVTKSDWYMAGE